MVLGLVRSKPDLKDKQLLVVCGQQRERRTGKCNDEIKGNQPIRKR